MTSLQPVSPQGFEKHLLQARLITPEQLSLARMQMQATGQRLSQALRSLGFVTPDNLVRSMLEYGSADLFDEELISATIPAPLLEATQTMVVTELEDTIYLATLQPSDQVSRLLKSQGVSKTLKFVPSNPARVSRYLSRLAQAQRPEQLLERFLHAAAKRKVSDIHVVPKEGSYLLMFRYLGVRYPEHEGSQQEYAHLVSRIKDLAKMDLAERRMPQDGAFSFEHESRSLDMRVATVPTVHGEYVVIRLLDPALAAPSLESLGVTRLDQWKAGVSRSDGLCLICGPTGSGKTTTLNASIRDLDRFGMAIFTAEDPVEARIPLVGQVNTNPALGLDFARVIKAFMRADPDVISVGEIRDGETARNALRGAETGHLVLATLHTESILGAIHRLHDLGVEMSELKHLLRSVLVQRLVRVPCSHCAGKGCEHCGNYGYVGRTVISECHYFKDADEVSRLLTGKRWWPSILEDAVQKVSEGRTTREEVQRLFGHEARTALEAMESVQDPNSVGPSRTSSELLEDRPAPSLEDADVANLIALFQSKADQ